MPNSSPTTAADLPLWSQFWTASRLKVSSNFRRSRTDVCFIGLVVHCSPNSLSVNSKQPQTHSRDKIRLKVIPKVFMDAPAGPRFVTHNALKHGDVWDGVCIEIANTGFLPVTLSQVGFLLDHGNRLLLLQPEFVLPLRLEARHSVTAIMKTPAPITEKSIVESLK